MGGATISRAAGTALAAVVAAGAAAAVWGIGIERYLFTLRTHEVSVLPPGSRPLRVLHISDLHMAPWQRRKQDWVAALAELGASEFRGPDSDQLEEAAGRLGLDVRCDGCQPGLQARVSYISPDPEFTPPVIYSVENRQKLVYRIEARPAAHDTLLRPGQIVDVSLATD